MPKAPVFSVVIPAYNCAAYLGEAIRSALGQTIGRDHVEVIVLDDGSSDDTPAVAQSFGEAVRFVQLNHGGVSKARNAGIDLAGGKYVAFLDADDYWLPERLERVFSLFQNRADFFVNTEFFIEVEGRRQETPYYKSRSLACLFDLDAAGQFDFAIEDNFISCMVIAPRKILVDAGGFNSALRYGEDWDLWLRLLDAGYPVRLVREPSAVYRYQRPGATTTRHDFAMATDRLNVLSKYPSAVSPYRWHKAQAIARRLRLKQAISRVLHVRRP